MPCSDPSRRGLETDPKWTQKGSKKGRFPYECLYARARQYIYIGTIYRRGGVKSTTPMSGGVPILDPSPDTPWGGPERVLADGTQTVRMLHRG